MVNRYDAPDARPFFIALRELARQRGETSLLLRDPEGDLYVAVGLNIEGMAARVQQLAEWERRKGRPPDVMADSGEIVTDFIPLYPPIGG